MLKIMYLRIYIVYVASNIWTRNKILKHVVIFSLFFKKKFSNGFSCTILIKVKLSQSHNGIVEALAKIHTMGKDSQKCVNASKVMRHLYSAPNNFFIINKRNDHTIGKTNIHDIQTNIMAQNKVTEICF